MILSIADIGLDIPWIEGLDESLRPFLHTGSRPPDTLLQIEVLAEFALPPELAWRFRCDLVWGVAEGGGRRFFIFGAQGEMGGARMIAEVDEAFRRIRLAFNPNAPSPVERLGDALRYPLDQVLLFHALMRHQGLLIHSAGVGFGARGESGGLVLAGVSGAGKSTITRLLGEATADSSEPPRLLSDDRMVVRRIDGVWWGFGTPWPGEAGVALAGRARLRALLFLEQQPENRIEPIPPAAALARLLPVVSIPWYDPREVEHGLAICERLIEEVPCYRFAFTRDGGSAAAVLAFAATSSD